MSNLRDETRLFLAELERNNVSPHTLRNYGLDLQQFVTYFSPPDGEAPEVNDITPLMLREWMGGLYRDNLTTVTIRRKLAAIRSFFKFLKREGRVTTNPARLVKTPRTPKMLPQVMTEEQANNLIDGVADDPFDKPHPERDLALMELLYGCGLRISEAVGLNIDDIDFTDRWLRVRGKGRKERQVPFAGKAAEALTNWLNLRKPSIEQQAVFLNHNGGRLTDRGARGIVKFYARMIAADDSIHPHSFRHAYATHMLSDGADLRAIQELLGHARLSTTQKYTHVALTDLMAVYDKAHPKA